MLWEKSRHMHHHNGPKFRRNAIQIILILLMVSGLGLSSVAASQRVDLRVDPPFWWTGMNNQRLQLLVHQNGIADYEIAVKGQGVRIDMVARVYNANYLFVYLDISPDAPAQTLQLKFHKKGDAFEWPYELKMRQPKPGRGLDASDMIYLVMPDRFANADTTNDRVEGMLDQSLGDAVGWYRKGGDLEGIRSHLDYIQSLHMTALWLNPAIINDQPKWSYHGYATTDHYRIDPRFGSLQDYLSLCADVHGRGMKMVLDLVHNHVGDHHWFYTDLPMRSWIHQWDEFTQTSYRAPALFDPHASRSDREIMSNGWFVRHMPDLDQTNVLLADYLIQNNIWWIELAGIDALRMDTWAYGDPDFEEKWTAAISAQFPDLTIFAETWVHGAATQAYYHGNTNLIKDFQPEGVNLTDFQLYYAIDEALIEEQSWTGGAARLYFTLAKDYLYRNPEKNVIFLDNHDLTRFASEVGEDPAKMRTGVNLLLTLRGIPSVYYGGEMDFSGTTFPTDANVRKPFPGGWPGDSINKFEESGRTVHEQQALEYFVSLADWRSKNPVVTQGSMTQFVPENGLYVYFRLLGNKTVMVIANFSALPHQIKAKRFDEILKGRRLGTDVVTKNSIELSGLVMNPWSSFVLEIAE